MIRSAAGGSAHSGVIFNGSYPSWTERERERKRHGLTTDRVLYVQFVADKMERVCARVAIEIVSENRYPRSRGMNSNLMSSSRHGICAQDRDGVLVGVCRMGTLEESESRFAFARRHCAQHGMRPVSCDVEIDAELC